MNSDVYNIFFLTDHFITLYNYSLTPITFSPSTSLLSVPVTLSLLFTHNLANSRTVHAALPDFLSLGTNGILDTNSHGLRGFDSVTIIIIIIMDAYYIKPEQALSFSLAQSTSPSHPPLLLSPRYQNPIAIPTSSTTTCISDTIPTLANAPVVPRQRRPWQFRKMGKCIICGANQGEFYQCGCSLDGSSDTKQTSTTTSTSTGTGTTSTSSSNPEYASSSSFSASKAKDTWVDDGKKLYRDSTGTHYYFADRK